MQSTFTLAQADLDRCIVVLEAFHTSKEDEFACFSLFYTVFTVFMACLISCFRFETPAVSPRVVNLTPPPPCDQQDQALKESIEGPLYKRLRKAIAVVLNSAVILILLEIQTAVIIGR